MNTAIIVAAGSGQRFASSQPKQFIPILGKPLIIHTLERFESCGMIDEIVLVLSDEGKDECSLVGKIGIKVSFVVGSARNIKITRPEDLILAEAFLKSL